MFALVQLLALAVPLLVAPPVQAAPGATPPATQAQTPDSARIFPWFTCYVVEPGGGAVALFSVVIHGASGPIDLPIGPLNRIEPGPADQGQPTRFFPDDIHPVLRVPLNEPVTWRMGYDVSTASLDGPECDNSYNDSVAPPTPVNLRLASQSGAVVRLEWDAVTDPGGVLYEIYEGGERIAFAGLETSVELANLAAGPHTLSVVARDGGANRSFPSSPVNVSLGETTPVVSVTASGSVTEGSSSPGAFTIRRSGSTEGALSVGLRLEGTAQNGTDYELIAAWVTIPVGAEAVVVPVRPRIDTLVEGDERISLSLNPGAGYTVGEPATSELELFDRLRLEVTPAAVLFTGPNESETLTLRAYNDANQEVALDGQDVEWVSSDLSQISVSGSGATAEVRAVIDVAGTTVSARLRSNTAIAAPPVNVARVELNPNVALVPDAAVVFPPPNLPPFELPLDYHLPDISAPDPTGNVSVGSFDSVEVAALIASVPDDPLTFRYPVVLRGSAPQIGSMLVASRGAEVFGRVVQTRTQDGFALVQLESIDPSDAFASYRFAASAQGTPFTPEQQLTLQQAGRVFLPLVASRGGTAAAAEVPGANQQASEPVDGMDCTFKGQGNRPTLRLLDVTSTITPVVQLNVQPPDQLPPESVSLRLGARAAGSVGVGLNVSNSLPSAEVSFACQVGEQKAYDVPIPGWLGIATSATITGTRSLEGSLKFQGAASITANIKCDIDGRVIFGFDYSRDTSQVEPHLDIGSDKHSCRFNFPQRETLGNLGKVKVDASVGFYWKIKSGVKFGGRYVERAERWGRRIPVIGDRLFDAINSLPILDILNGKVGADAKLSWENVYWILPAEASRSKGDFGPVIDLKLSSDSLNKLLERLNINQQISMPLYQPSLPRLNFYRPPTKDTIAATVNGRALASDSPIVVAAGDTLSLTVNNSYSNNIAMVVPDEPVERGELWNEANGSYRLLEGLELTATGPRTLAGSLTITEEVCTWLKQTNGLFKVAGYNRFGGDIPTPGYLGRLTLVCSDDEVLFTADEIAFPTPDGTNIAIVGNRCVRPNDPPELRVAYQVRLRSGIYTKPNNEWAVENARFFLDGAVLASGDGTSPLLLPGGGAPVVRDLQPGEHIFKMEYTAVKGTERRNMVKEQPFVVRLKYCPDEESVPRMRFPPNGGGGPSRDAATGGEDVWSMPGGGGGGSGTRRPSGGGSPPPPPMRPEPMAQSWGDPHLVTLDGLAFTSLELGEFVYVRDRLSADGLELQARHQRLPGFPDWASFITAAAVRADGYRFEVRLPPAGEQQLLLLINGSPSRLDPGTYSFGDAVVRVSTQNDITIWGEPTASERRARVTIGVGSDDLAGASNEPAEALTVTFATLPLNRYHGMLGTDDGSAATDWSDRSGTLLTSASAVAEAWRIASAAESLFTYAPGQSPATFNIPQTATFPDEAYLLGNNPQNRNYIEQARGLLADSCQANLDKVDPSFIRSLALELAAGRSPANLLASGLCDDQHVTTSKPARPLVQMTFSGQVLLEGRPDVAIPGARVRITASTPVSDSLLLCDARTFNQGRYACSLTEYRDTFGDLSELPLTYEVSETGPTITTSGSIVVPVAGQSATAVANLEARPAALLQLTGTVFNIDGTPFANGAVRISGPSMVQGRTNAAGVYTLHMPLPTGITNGALTFEAADLLRNRYVRVNGTFNLGQAGGETITQDLRLADRPVPIPQPEEQVPELTLASNSFSEQMATNTERERSLVITNTGTLPLTLTVALEDAAAHPWVQLGAAPATLAPGTGVAVPVRFNTAGLNGGTYQASIVITSNAPNRRTLQVPITLAVTSLSATLSEPQLLTNVNVSSAPPALGADGTLYMLGSGTNGGNVVRALNPDGSLRWTSAPAFTGSFNLRDIVPVVGNNGTIYVTGNTNAGGGLRFGTIYAIDPATGALRTLFTGPPDHYYLGDVAIGADGTVYVAMGPYNGTGALYAIDPESGQVRWSRPVAGWDGYSGAQGEKPVVGADGSVYLGHQKLYAFTATGEPKWAQPYDYQVEGGCSAEIVLGADDTLYANVSCSQGDSSASELQAINPDGTRKWRATGGVAVRSLLVGPNGLIYTSESRWDVPTWDSVYEMVARTPATGAVVRTYATTSTVLVTPVIGADGRIYACVPGAQDQSLMLALSPELAVEASSSLPRSCTGGAITMAANGTLYAMMQQSGGTRLYRLTSSAGGLAATGWPSRYHNSQQTSRMR